MRIVTVCGGARSGGPVGWRFPGGAASSARRFCGSYVAVARWRGAYPTVRRRSGGDSLAVVWGLPDGVALNLVWRRLNRHPTGAIASELGNRLVRGSYKWAERGWPRHPDPDIRTPTGRPRGTVVARHRPSFGPSVLTRYAKMRGMTRSGIDASRRQEVVGGLTVGTR